MPNYLIVCVLFLSGCMMTKDTYYERLRMSEKTINGISVNISGPQSLPISIASDKSPKHVPSKTFFTITVKNETDSNVVIPFDEISRNRIRIYRNPETGAEYINNRTPPPRAEGIVADFSPNESKSFQAVFDFPEAIAKFTDKKTTIQFCVQWEKKRLRSATYTENSFDWNEDFEICQEIVIIDDIS